MMLFQFCTSHVHTYFMHTYLFFSFFFVLFVMCFLSLSLSLLDILHTAPKHKSTLARNPLSSRSSSSDTPLLHIWFHVGRPNRTSLRTFKNVAFIRSTMSFCWTFLTLLYPVLFTLEDGNLFVRYP